MKLQIHKSLLFLLIAFTSVGAIAQKKIFLDASGKKTKEKVAYYYRYVTPEGSNFLVKDYFRSNDQLQMEGRYKSKKLEPSTRTGQFTTYYKNGQKEAEGDYVNGKADGPWTYWFGNGQKKSEGKYDNGDKDGPWEFFHKNGQLLTKLSMKDGERDGSSVFYYDNGDKQEDYSFSKGKMDGPFSQFFKGGKIKAKGKYVKDSLEGPYEYFWANGNLSMKGEYSDNKAIGVWEFYHSNGKKSCETEYKKGKFVKAAFFDEEGSKLSKKVYEDDLIKSEEFPGGREKMREIVNQQIVDKVDFTIPKQMKLAFVSHIVLEIDEEGNIVSREWKIPNAVEDDDYDDEHNIVKNINAAIDDFPKFQPKTAYNRKVSSYAHIYYGITFEKKPTSYLLLY